MNATPSRFSVRIFSLSLLFSFFALYSAYAQYDGGDGTEEDPWQIATIEQLQSISDHPDAHFILAADIDASSTIDWNEGLGFEPIGNSDTRFSGSLDGNGFTISNLTINRESQNNIGLFGVIQNGTLQNIILTNAVIIGRNYTGGLVGSLLNGSIQNSAVSGVITGNDFTGGLTGTLSESNIHESYSSAVITAEMNIGGLSGFSGDSKISNSYSVSEVNGNRNVGGLIGIVMAVTSYPQDLSNTAVFVSGSYTAGLVNGDEYTGGLIGEIEWIVLTKSADYSAATISDTDSVLTSYWDIEMTGQANAVGTNERWEGFRIDTSGASTSAMWQQSTYEGWDFDETWSISEGDSYPWLQELGMPVSNEPEPHLTDLPRSVELHQNYPNPFNPVTVIGYQLPESRNVTLEVYDITGRRVATLVDGLQQAGQHQATFDASNLASGVYFYRLHVHRNLGAGGKAGDFIQARQMVLVK